MIKHKIEEINTDEFIIYHHLGLGDHIICNGFVNYLSNQNKKIHLAVNKLFFKQIEHLYSENHNVQIFPVELDSVNDADKIINNYSLINDLPILKVGFEIEQKSKLPFYKAFYSQLDLKYNLSYKYFHCPSDNNRESNLKNHLFDEFNIKSEKFMLIHSESSVRSYDLKIRNKFQSIDLKIEHDIYNNIFLYKKIIQEANEIHCINSSFAHLIDRIDTSGKLIYHDIRGTKIKFKKRWKVMNYANKY